MRLQLRAPADFEFVTAVCSHGFFLLAPNRWDAARRTLRTVVTLDGDRAVEVAIGANGQGLVLQSPGRHTGGDREVIRQGVRRVLRLDEDLSVFHKVCFQAESHRQAAEMRFGRLIRSASLFEDIVKVICTCNVTWRQTVAMVGALVRHWGVPAGDGERRGFPTPDRLAEANVTDVQRLGRVGYRARYIHELASGVVTGTIDLNAFEGFNGSSEELHRALCRLPGIGGYGAANLCMLLGRYDHLAVDTEMVRFMRTRFPRRRLTPATIRAHYRRWHPYEFLAYWFELWQDYAREHGEPASWAQTGAGSALTSRR